MQAPLQTLVAPAEYFRRVREHTISGLIGYTMTQIWKWMNGLWPLWHSPSFLPSAQAPSVTVCDAPENHSMEVSRHVGSLAQRYMC